MWSLEQDINHHGRHHGRNSAVVSSSSSSRSSPSSNSSVLVPQSAAAGAATPKRRTMEDVWKDINLTTLRQERHHQGYGPHHHQHHQHQRQPQHHHHQHHHLTGCSSPSFRNVILQDFFAAGPLSRPLPAMSPPAVQELQLPPPPQPPPPPPPPVLPQTALSLNSGLEFQFLGHDANSHSSSASNVGPTAASFISSAFSAVIAGPPSPTGLFSLCSKKRLPDNTATTGVDRHHKRMIKNRESAARSRARKQAYTNELELEVSHLKEENTKLKKQCDELRLTMGNQQLKRNALQRSSTAPF